MIKRQISVSVIIPAYNVHLYIDECIDSVVNQTFQDFEIILVDDGSTDGTDIKCEEWAKRDSRIRVIHKENGGPSVARNRGILEARGIFLSFLDADDRLEPCFLEKLQSAMISQKADMAECDVWRVNNITGDKTLRRISGVMGKEYSLEEQMEYGYTAIWKCMFRRELFIENNLWFSDCHSEAKVLYPLLLSLSKKRIYIPEPLYCYRLFREGSLTVVPRQEKGGTAEGIKAYEILIESFKQYGFYEAKREVLKKMVLVKLSDALSSFFTKRRTKEFEVLTEAYRKFVQENFQEYQDRIYLNIGGYNLNRILSNMNLLHDSSGRFNFSSLISIMHPPEGKYVLFHKNRYRQIMLERERNNMFWKLMEERKPDFVALDFVEERFDVIVYQSGYLTKSDAFDGCEERPEADRIILRDSEECMALWQESALSFIRRMLECYPKTKIVLIKNYLAEKKGDIDSQEYFENLNEIRRMNRILGQYYMFFQRHCKTVKAVETLECQYYFTDKEYEYGAIPSHLNELVNREIAGKVEDCIKL